jgi:hypothetical protein
MESRDIVKPVNSLESDPATQGIIANGAAAQPTIVLVEPDPYLGFLIRLHVPEANVLEAPVGATAEDIKAMISSGDVKAELPTALDSSHQSALDKLKSLKGADFSSRYDSDQVSGHKDAVSLFERYAKSGENAKLKDWADKTLPALRHHLEMAQDLAAGKTVGSH